jgi:putative transposase
MYLQGVSTRRVTTVMEKLCGMEVTSCQVSRLTAEMDVEFEKTAPALSTWMEASIPEGLTVLRFEEAQHKRLRTSNMCENLNRQIKRRTRVAGLFPNEKSILRLVTAVLMETSEEWETGKSYLTLTPQNRIPDTQNQQQTAA